MYLNQKYSLYEDSFIITSSTSAINKMPAINKMIYYKGASFTL